MNAATYVINTAMSPHLVEWYTDIYTHIYGIDTTYTDVLSQFNTYLKQMINSANFTTFSNMILTIGIVLMLFHFFGDLTESVKPAVFGAVLASLIISGVLGIIDKKLVSKRNRMLGVLS